MNLTFIDKVKELVTSIRFWILTLTGVSAILAQYSAGGLTVDFFFNTVKVYLIAVATVGTIDSAATKIGATKTVTKKK